MFDKTEREKSHYRETVEYPRVMYHATNQQKTVKNKEEEDALGPGWARKRFPVPEVVAPIPPQDVAARLTALEAEVAELKRAAAPPKVVKK